jgi:divalent metal cation (Fe/Co/Zn/Cd) transporter
VISLSVNDLLDGALEESLQIIIMRELAARFDSYAAFHGVRSRRSGRKVFIELFLEFPQQQTLESVLHIINCIKDDISMEIPVSDVVVIPARSTPA